MSRLRAAAEKAVKSMKASRLVAIGGFPRQMFEGDGQTLIDQPTGCSDHIVQVIAGDEVAD